MTFYELDLNQKIKGKTNILSSLALLSLQKKNRPNCINKVCLQILPTSVHNIFDALTVIPLVSLQRGDLVMNGIGHVGSFVRAISIQSCLAPVSYKETQQAARNSYLLIWVQLFCIVMLVFCLRIFVITCASEFHATRNRMMKLNKLKHFQKAPKLNSFDYTNWQLKICIWRLNFSRAT